MIDKFEQWFEGTFNNKIQAFTNPSKYAYIVVKHKKISDHLFYGEQAYFNKTKTPYRQFLLKIEENDGKIIVRNHEIHNKSRYVGFVNLQELVNQNLIYKEGCDTIFTFHETQFVGNIESGCKCMVNWGSQETYLVNNAILTETCYNVEDRGHDPKTNQQVWGSRHGHFMFKRLPL